MITIVDRDNSHVVQKVSHDGKTVRFQVAPRDRLGDSSLVTVCSTLAQARLLIGKTQGGKPLGSRSNP